MTSADRSLKASVLFFWGPRVKIFDFQLGLNSVFPGENFRFSAGAKLWPGANFFSCDGRIVFPDENL